MPSFEGAQPPEARNRRRRAWGIAGLVGGSEKAQRVYCLDSYVGGRTGLQLKGFSVMVARRDDRSEQPATRKTNRRGARSWCAVGGGALSWALSACGLVSTGSDPDDTVHWQFEELESVADHETEVLGSVRLEEADGISTLSFDGVDDALLVHSLPLAGAKEFTLEIVFRPDVGGLTEQRFLHLQEDGSENRILIETRLFEDEWALDSYIDTPAGSHALYNASVRHKLGEWYSIALVYDGQTMRHYVNGTQELDAAPLDFQPLGPGKVSIGVRMNRVFWFKGAVRSVRFTRRVRAPDEFLSRHLRF
jgi:hypothetical protein